MKKIMTLMLMGILLMLATASCKTTKADCDAYSNVDKVENSDLASK